jgi:DNA-binding CsgD family transcriptional regulator
MRALPERTRAALVLLAASDAGDLTVVSRAAARSGLDVADLVPAEERDLVQMDGRAFEFRHPLMRSAIYGDAPPEARRAAHRALADALPDKEADRRAWHLALAATGPDAAASSALEQAGARAHGRSAYAVAAPAFERAAALAPEEARAAGLLYAAADAAWLAGNAAHAVGLLDRAAEANDGDLRLGIRIDHLRGQIAARRGPVDEARRILSAAAERAVEVDPEQAVVMLVGATNASFYAGDAGAMVESAQRAAELAPRVGGSAELLARLAHGMALVFAGEGEPGAPLIRDAVVELEASAELRDDPYLVVWAALGPLWLREAEVGRSLYERALALVRSRTALGALPELLVHLARDWATTDQWAAAHAAYDEGLALARESGQGIALAFGLSGLAWLDARQGRDEDCRRRAAEGAEIAAQLGAAVHGLWTLAALADLETGRGRPDEALPHLEAWAEQLRARGIADVDLSPGPELVETYLRLGRTDEAAAAAEQHDAAARAKGQPWALARAARCRGLLASDDDVEDGFEEALRLHAQTPDVFEAARTELAYGSRLRRAGRRVRARERLRVAVRIFDDLGAEPWSELARAELAATGETARKRDVSTLDQLTPQELQIALLLAGGRTTREAAAAMFLSPKTIEYHLRNAYRKLGVNSRAALAEALERRNAAAASLG